VLELVKQHLDECENMEKRKINDAHVADRIELMGGGNGGGNDIYVNVGKGSDQPIDPYTSELPDIDAENDMKDIKRRDQEIVLPSTNPRTKTSTSWERGCSG
jgi:hypothetical protein